MLNILFGPPGSGKTTVIQEIKRHHSLTYISVGAIYRSELEKGTDFSNVLKFYVESNIKYPKEIIEKIIEPRFRKIALDEVVVLDGFPRHEHELEILHHLLYSQRAIRPGHVIILQLSKVAARNRIIKRRTCTMCDYHGNEEGICPKCGGLMEKRHDDNLSRFSDRFDTYVASSKKLVTELTKIGFQPMYIDADKTKQQVYNDILELLFKNDTVR